MEIELVCFDLGGVLVPLARDWAHALEISGATLPAEGFAAEGWTRHQLLSRQFEIGALDQAAYEAAVRECLPGMDCDAYWRVFDAWMLGIWPGVEELLAEIHAARRKTAVLSNNNPRHWRSLMEEKQFQPLKKIHYLLASQEIRCRKPDPIAYHSVEQATGIRPHQILFFDDRAENVEAARHAGWQAEQIDPSRDGVVQVRHFLKAHGVVQ